MEKLLLLIILLTFLSLFFLHILFTNSLNKKNDIKISLTSITNKV